MVDLKGYKEIPYAPGYFINVQGDVYSNLRKKGFLKSFKVKGYPKVAIKYDGKYKPKYLHRLIMQTFCPVHNCDDLEINHKNGVRDDNRIDNLEWVTSKENQIHAVDVLGRRRGERSSTAVLNRDLVLEIRKRLDSGESPTDMASEYNVTRSAIYAIKFKRTWRHI